jgi:hypothetical protein
MRFSSRAIRRSSRLVLAVLFVIGSAQLAAQAPGPGARVRVTLSDSLRFDPFIGNRMLLMGTVTRMTADSLAVRIADDTLQIPRARIRRLDVSRGVSRTRSAIHQGLAFGIAAILVAVPVHDDIDEVFSGQRILISASTGAAFGAVLGAVRPYEHWRRVNR